MTLLSDERSKLSIQDNNITIFNGHDYINVDELM